MDLTETGSLNGRGFFLTFEGIDGSGKSTQAAMLVEHLQQRGVAVTATREPGGTLIGEAVRSLVLNPEYRNMAPACEALLYAASRAQLVHEVIGPALERGCVVVCERFVDSSLVYQGLGLGLGLDEVAGINRVATGGLVPDLTVYFDIEPAAGLARVKAARRERDSRPEANPDRGQAGERRYAMDRVEQRHVDFHERVRRGYLELARREPERFCVIKVDNHSPEEVNRQVWARIWPALVARGLGEER